MENQPLAYPPVTAPMPSVNENGAVDSRVNELYLETVTSTSTQYDEQAHSADLTSSIVGDYSSQTKCNNRYTSFPANLDLAKYGEGVYLFFDFLSFHRWLYLFLTVLALAVAVLNFLRKALLSQRTHPSRPRRSL